MHSIITRLSLAAVLAGGVVLTAAAQAPPAAPPPAAPQAIKMVKPGLFMVTGAGGNSVVRITSDGLVVVDGKNAGQPIYDALKGQIATVSAQPVKWLINTHHHGDHTGNNARFIADGAKVVGHANLPLELDKFVAPANNPAATAPAKPTVTYTSRYRVALGGKVVQLSHFSNAHTRGDTVVYFPDLKVVAMGDEFVNQTPNVDFAGGGSLVGLINSLTQTMKLDWDTAIPGHGDNPMTREDMTAYRAKLQTLLDRAREQVKAGTPKDRLIAGIRTDDLWTFAANFWTPVRVDGLYAEAGGR
jgi:glyoxylase-like metal-dependent hydrolase (beta-lactamase superfamily II)